MPQLESGDVHLWTVQLDPMPQDNVLRDVLSSDERNRAARFHFSEHRALYEQARFALRCIVGAYIAINPAAVQFEYGPYGKPELAGDNSLRFNLSHSGDLAIVGLAKASPVGVDVERIRPVHEVEGVARRFFRPEEADAVLARNGRERIRAFFRIWTRKESLLKLTGEGLHRPLNTLLSTDLETEHLDVVPGHAILGLPETVYVHSAAFGSEYVGAIAYYGTRRRVVQFDWNNLPRK